MSADPEDGDVYRLPEAPGKLAITRLGLLKLAQAAGVTWTGGARVDDGTIDHYCLYRAEAKVRDIDGAERNSINTRLVDLRDGSPQIARMKDGQLRSSRAFLVQHAETKARNRVLRDLLGLKSTYTPEQLEKPFVVYRVVPAPPVDDPIYRALLFQTQLSTSSQVWGPPPAGLPIAPATVIEAHPVEGAPEKIAQIARINDLYEQKLGRTRTEYSPNKPPLEQLSDHDLNEIERILSAKPDWADAETDL